MTHKHDESKILLVRSKINAAKFFPEAKLALHQKSTVAANPTMP
jgi:hypothetical protein